MTIKHIGIRHIPMRRMKLPGDWRSICQRPAVTEMMKLIALSGGKPIHPPTLQMPDYKLIAGRTRLAALTMMGKQEAEVKLIACSDMEAEMISDLEDCARRHDTTEQDAKTLNIIRHMTALGQEGEGLTEIQARQSARRELAAHDGVQSDTIRKREDRAKAQEDALAAAAEAGPVYPIETWGLPMSMDAAARAGLIQSHLKKVRGHMHAASMAIGKMVKDDLPFPDPIIDDMKEMIGNVRDACDMHTPTHLCPYCKGRQEFKRECQECHGRAWASRLGMAKNVPAQLLSANYVWSDAKLVILADQHDDEAI